MSQETGARICLVTTEILGVTRTGGIATMLSALADLLVAEGHAVTVLCVNGPRAMDGTFADWVAHYRRRGVTLAALPAPGTDPLAPVMAGVWVRGTLARRWAVLAWLAARRFDLVHFNDWGGDALLCGRARRQGLALGTTRLVLGLHGASDWTLIGNDTPLDDLTRLIQIEMERAAPSLMDAVWAPGPFMPGWLARRGAPVPGVRILPQLVPDPGPRRPSRPATPVTELVLFGRLEDRKGLPVLFDALDRLTTAPGPHPTRVTFLGRAATVHGEPAGRVIARRAAAWPWPVSVLDTLDRDAALTRLQAPGCLALVLAPMENSPLTLHECLALGVPVLASATGGIPDLIAPEDRDRVLVPYAAPALAARLSAVLGTPFAPARPAAEAAAAAAAWRAWHRALLARPAALHGPQTHAPALFPVQAPANRACAAWAAALARVEDTEGPVCLLTDADHLDPDALPTVAAILVRTGADLLAPGWHEGTPPRLRLCLDSVPASACAVNLVAGPGLVLGPRARRVAVRDWDPDSGLWGLVALCVAAGLRHEAAPVSVLTRAPVWRDPSAALARAPRLWAGPAAARDADLLAATLAGTLAQTDPASNAQRGDAGTADPWRPAARRDRRRARALWRSWPWRMTRPLRNRRRRRHGLAPEPAEPPPLTAPGTASAVLWEILVSRSWALTAAPRAVASLLRRLRGSLRHAAGCIRSGRMDS
ncbi:glycosyltransferase [Roseospira goensis]|uniref:Glycosyltransferase involved in cell wall biosynthesis n=1 Tax=Roseospira goensis TaxID=391922 RepID=A0A7W6WJQ6_9PROT|nr:glycosyltransferase involved in cell wall biosynthesis [Roseospira goensis]